MRHGAAGGAALLLLALFASNAGATTQVALQVGRIEGAALPAALRDVHMSCVLQLRGDALHCDDGKAALSSALSGAVSATFGAALARDGGWTMTADAAAARIDLGALAPLLQRAQPALKPQLAGSAQLTLHAQRSRVGAWQGRYDSRVDALTFGEASGRYATDTLALRSHGSLQLGDDSRGEIDAALSSDSGQLYVEPVFVDLGAEPASLQLSARFTLPAGGELRLPGAIRALHLQAQQRGVFDGLEVRGAVTRLGTAPEFSGDIRVIGAQLHTLLPRYAAPYLAGGTWQDIGGGGSADATLTVVANRPTAVDIELGDIGLKAGTPAVQVDGLAGSVHWRQAGESPPSTLAWRGAQYGELPIGAAAIHAQTQGRDLRLLQPPRLPILGGALVVDTLDLRDIGSAQLQARFAANIEPIDLAALCKALGWPEFGGEISGRIPGVAIRDNELAFDGSLTIKAFDGEIRVGELRMPEVFGRLPRVLANLQLRNIDLQAVTQAFSFGRIEGRLSGDVDNLRLLSWLPVAFDARLYTPADDRSRHRISQRAIDNLSSLGGGSTGLLQRGVLRFFEDFAYARIGWSCKLANGVCAMDGIKPAGDGGYLLVQGRLLPRIDVIGYERRVDWDRFVAQLLSIRGTEGVEVR